GPGTRPDCHPRPPTLRRRHSTGRPGRTPADTSISCYLSFLHRVIGRRSPRGGAPDETDSASASAHPSPRCRRPLQPPDPMAADDDGADDHAYSGHTLAAAVMSTVSYISHDAGACLKSHISYIATYACTIAMPASVPTRVRSAIPFACFRAVCRVSCMDFAAGDGPLGTL